MFTLFEFIVIHFQNQPSLRLRLQSLLKQGVRSIYTYYHHSFNGNCSEPSIRFVVFYIYYTIFIHTNQYNILTNLYCKRTVNLYNHTKNSQAFSLTVPVNYSSSPFLSSSLSVLLSLSSSRKFPITPLKLTSVLFLRYP